MPLKLFVVGAESADPRMWSRGNSTSALVIANDPAEAKSLVAGRCLGPVFEMPLDHPRLLSLTVGPDATHWPNGEPIKMS